MLPLLQAILLSKSFVGKYLITEQSLSAKLHSWDSKNRTWELTDVLRPAIVSLDWQKGGQTVFKSVNYAGYIGVLTAVKQVGFLQVIRTRRRSRRCWKFAAVYWFSWKYVLLMLEYFF